MSFSRLSHSGIGLICLFIMASMPKRVAGSMLRFERASECIGSLSNMPPKITSSRENPVVTCAFIGGFGQSHRHSSGKKYSMQVQKMQEKSESRFICEVKETVDRVLHNHGNEAFSKDILSVDPRERQNLGVARNLYTRLQALDRSGDCTSCWLQKAHCVCHTCPPIEKLPRNVGRIFLLMHHKEVGLVVDTAKLILRAFPDKCRLVVGGIDATYQESMAELNAAMGLDCKPQSFKNVAERRKCLVLFPADDARTFEELDKEYYENTKATRATEQLDSDDFYHNGKWDVIIIDGTWSQARKLQRQIPLEAAGGPPRVQLSQEALAFLSQRHENSSKSENDGERSPRSGLQLRRHPIKWREISTVEATRLLLCDMASVDSNRCIDHPWNTLAEYQNIADSAARKQLGPPRELSK